MRKPLVVVCLAASAVLFAGAVAATTAGAEITPDRPEVPGAAPGDGPGAPGTFPGDAGVFPAGGPGAGAFPGDGPGAPGAAGMPGGTAWSQPADGDGSSDLSELVAQAQAGQADRHAGRPAAERPAAQDPTAQDPAAERPAAQRPAAERPAAERPAAQRPAAERPARPQGAGSADGAVTRGSVSGSVDAPMQRQALALVNEHRRRGGCPSVTPDRRLIAAANRHAADMAGRGYFAHSSPDGDGTAERVEDAGYRWSRYGENIARGQASVSEVVDGWMASPEHRANIMDCRLHQMGVGLAFAGDDQPYWVQDFATPKG